VTLPSEASWAARRPNRIRAINFSFNHDSAAQGMTPVSFDIWLDGLRFLAVEENGNVAATGVGGTGGGP
jgi:hypothetical protein